MAFWSTIGNLAGDAFAQTQAGQDINGAYNIWNKIANNPQSQLIGSSPNTSTTPPSVAGKDDVIKKYINNQSAPQAIPDVQPIGNTGPNQLMPWAPPVKSHPGIIGGLLKTAAIGALV